MQLHTYLNFSGQCEEAFKFYEQALGGKILFMMRNSEAPPSANMPAGQGDKIMHARISVGDQMLMGSDMQAGCMEKPQGFQVTINTTDVAEAERIFNALKPDAQIRMPLEETFWAVRFGMLTDRFGIPWMVNCEKPMQS